MKATKLKIDVHLNRGVAGPLVLSASATIGPAAPIGCAHWLSLAPGGRTAAVASSSCAFCLIQSACFEVGGNNWSPVSHFSRARCKSPVASSAFASAESRSSSSECTSAWHCSHTSAPGASSREQRLQLRIGSGLLVDTAELTLVNSSDSKPKLVPHALASRSRRLSKAP